MFLKTAKASIKTLYTRTPFEQQCGVPALLGCEVNSDGYITTNSSQKTSVYGVFACGDNTTRIRTVANAVATGSIGGMMVNKELIEEAF